MNCFTQRNIQQGFTLFELTGYLLIVTVLLSSSALNLSDSLGDIALRNELNLIERKFNSLKYFAAHSGCTAFASFEDKELKYFLEADCLATLAGSNPLATDIQYSTNQNPYRFSPAGVASPGRIKLINGDSECHLIISLRGRIRRECF